MRAGIIGCGKIAQVRHIPEYLENEHAELAGYFDFNLERARTLAQKYGGKAYESMESMLEDREIDVVSVCVANSAHAEVTIQALEHGKHVLCEKPMAVTLEECRKMVNAAEKNGKCLMIGQNQRFAKAHEKAKRLLEEGVIGDVLTFRTTFGHQGPETWSVDGKTDNWFFDKARAAMGAMADLGVHKTDLIRYLLGQDIVEVTAQMATLDKRDSQGSLIGVDDNAVCIYRMANGVLGTMTASWTYYGEEDNSTVLYGTKGIMRIYSCPEYSIQVEMHSGEKIFYQMDQIQTNDSQTKSGIIDAFVEAVVNGQEPLVSGKDVLNTMEAVFAGVESSKKGTVVKIEA